MGMKSPLLDRSRGGSSISSSMGTGTGFSGFSCSSFAAFSEVVLFFEPGLRPRLAFGLSSVASAGAAAGSSAGMFSGCGASAGLISSLNTGIGAGKAGVFASNFCALSLVAV